MPIFSNKKAKYRKAKHPERTEMIKMIPNTVYQKIIQQKSTQGKMNIDFKQKIMT